MTTSEGSGGSRPRRKLLLLALPVLFVLAVLVNLSSLTQIVQGKKSLKSIVYGLSQDASLSLAGWKIPRDTGAAEAKVVVEVFVMAGDPCHADTAIMGQALGTIDPKRIRVKFMNTANDKAAVARRDKVKLGCDQGVAINGKTEFKIPDPANPGKQKTVFTAHQHGGPGTPAPLYAILNQQLKAAYHGQGLALTQAQFDERLAAEGKRIREVAEAAAEARQEADKKR